MESYSDDDTKDSSGTSGRPRFRFRPPIRAEQPPKPDFRPPLESLIYKREEQQRAKEELQSAVEGSKKAEEHDEVFDDDDEEAVTAVSESDEHQAEESTQESPAPLQAMFDVHPGEAGATHEELPPMPDSSFEDAHQESTVDDTSGPHHVAAAPHVPASPTELFYASQENADPLDDTAPPPPPPPPPGFREPGGMPPPEQPYRPSPFERAQMYGGTPPAVEVVSDPDAEFHAERRGLRRGLVAGFLTGYLLKRYLANKKMDRYQKETGKQFEKQQEQITYLTAEQQAAQEQLRRQQEALNHARRLAEQQKPEVVPVQPPPEKPLVERLWPTQENELQPTQHVEQSAWHNIVVDEHGREVQGAITYGEAFIRERQKEQAPVQFGQGGDQGGASGGGADQGLPIVTSNLGPLNAPRTGDDSTGLPLGHPSRPDSQLRLSKPVSPWQATLANPWVWLMAGILVVVFFIVAFI